MVRSVITFVAIASMLGQATALKTNKTDPKTDLVRQRILRNAHKPVVNMSSDDDTIRRTTDSKDDHVTSLLRRMHQEPLSIEYETGKEAEAEEKERILVKWWTRENKFRMADSNNRRGKRLKGQWSWLEPDGEAVELELYCLCEHADKDANCDNSLALWGFYTGYDDEELLYTPMASERTSVSREV